MPKSKSDYVGGLSYERCPGSGRSVPKGRIAYCPVCNKLVKLRWTRYSDSNIPVHKAR